MAYAVSESLRSGKAAIRRKSPLPINWERLIALSLNFAVWGAVIAGARALFWRHG